MVTVIVEDYHNDSDSEESIVSHNEEEDYFGIREQNPSQGSNWTYFVQSDRGGEAYSMANGNDPRVTRRPSRMGRKTSKMCPVCKIVLCKQ